MSTNENLGSPGLFNHANKPLQRNVQELPKTRRLPTSLSFDTQPERRETRPALQIGVQTEASSAHPLRDEDHYVCSADHGIAAVFDGLGGSPAAEIASTVAGDVLEEALMRKDISLISEIFASSLNTPHTQEDVELAMVELIDRLNEAVAATASRKEVRDRARLAFEERNGHAFNATSFEDQRTLHKTCKGQSTTASLLKIWSDFQGKDFVTIGHVGDSRIYRRRQHQLERLTRDHSLVQPLLDLGILTSDEDSKQIIKRADILHALADPFINEETKCYLELLDREFVSHHRRRLTLGSFNHYVVQFIGDLSNLEGYGLTFSPFIRTEELKAGDEFLVMSDGVYENLTEAAIEQIFQRYNKPGDTLEMIALAIRHAAYASGLKPDDITIAIVRYEGKEKQN